VSAVHVPALGVRERLSSHLRVPMFRDGYALVLSGMVTAVFGAAYWVVAAHSYSAEYVGLNSAAISAMMLIAGIAQLNLSSALIRFVPLAGRSTRRVILGSYLVSIAVAGVLGVVFLLVQLVVHLLQLVCVLLEVGLGLAEHVDERFQFVESVVSLCHLSVSFRSA